MENKASAKELHVIAEGIRLVTLQMFAKVGSGHVGYFPKEMLDELNQNGGHLPSHCDRTKTPGIDMTTGSLGQGMSTAIGIALGCRMNKSDSTTYLIVGDGECNEGFGRERFLPPIISWTTSLCL